MTCNGWIFLWVRRGAVSSIYPTQIQHIPKNFQIPKKGGKIDFFFLSDPLSFTDTDDPVYSLLHILMGGI